MQGFLDRRYSVLRWCAVPVVLVTLLLPSASNGTSSAPVSKSVLVITEVGVTHRAAASITESLLSALATNQEYQVEFSSENLDTPAFADEASQQKLEDLLVEQYQGRKIDVIVAMGPRPIMFMSHFAKTFFPDVPVVFGGSSEEQAGNPTLGPRFTGSWMKLEPAKTLDAILKLLPQTQHVVVVGGTSAFDKGIEAPVRADLSSHHPAAVDVTYLTDVTMTDLLERLRHLASGTVILYTTFFRDAAGNQFVNATTALPMVSAAANAPVFGISDTYLGHGIVGGYVLSFADQGKTASELVLDIFRGKKPGDINISPSVYMFDWKQLQRWGLSERDLPPGSIVLFRGLSVWERAKWIILTTVLVILGLACLTLYLLFNRRQLRLARDQQIRLSGMLINAQEDERKRLASELHDDFSQRLALLSLGLETAAELVPDSPKEANEQLHELINSASELGADLHTVSHRLHSSTLERLGLVPGIGAFCKEFSAQQGVQVVFTHDDAGARVPPAVALCLFRIVQEGLRNVKKHSGASRAQVALDQLDGNLHLSVSDDGAGFDVQDTAKKQGLGLFSMEERARLIGARFEIHSETHKGTRIDVWVSRQQQAKSESLAVVEQPAVYET
jgi:signal transduction histidine kinase